MSQLDDEKAADESGHIEEYPDDIDPAILEQTVSKLDGEEDEDGKDDNEAT
jgi:hypothetical protein